MKASVSRSCLLRRTRCLSLSLHVCAHRVAKKTTEMLRRPQSRGKPREGAPEEEGEKVEEPRRCLPPVCKACTRRKCMTALRFMLSTCYLGSMGGGFRQTCALVCKTFTALKQAKAVQAPKAERRPETGLQQTCDRHRVARSFVFGQESELEWKSGSEVRPVLCTGATCASGPMPAAFAKYRCRNSSLLLSAIVDLSLFGGPIVSGHSLCSHIVPIAYNYSL